MLFRIATSPVFTGLNGGNSNFRNILLDVGWEGLKIQVTIIVQWQHGRH